MLQQLFGHRRVAVVIRIAPAPGIPEPVHPRDFARAIDEEAGGDVLEEGIVVRKRESGDAGAGAERNLGDVLRLSDEGHRLEAGDRLGGLGIGLADGLEMLAPGFHTGRPGEPAAAVGDPGARQTEPVIGWSRQDAILGGFGISDSSSESARGPRRAWTGRGSGYFF